LADYLTSREPNRCMNNLKCFIFMLSTTSLTEVILCCLILVSGLNNFSLVHVLQIIVFILFIVYRKHKLILTRLLIWTSAFTLLFKYLLSLGVHSKDFEKYIQIFGFDTVDYHQYYFSVSWE